jgi:hypothetical protein
MRAILSFIALLAFAGSASAQSRAVTVNPTTNVLLFPTEANFRSANGFLGLGLAEVSGDLGLDFSELPIVTTLTASEHVIIQTAAGPQRITRANLATLIGGGGGTFDIDALGDGTAITFDDYFTFSDGGTEKRMSPADMQSWIEGLSLDFSLISADTVDATALNALNLTINGGATPTTDAFGEMSTDNDAWAASRGAPQFFDGTASTYLVGVAASDIPTDGQTPRWNTGGTITWETPAAGLADGDKVDITISASGATWNIDANAVGTTEIADDAVTYAKIQNVSATNKVLGRSTAGAGDIEEISSTGNGNVMRTRTGVYRTIYVDAGAMISRTTAGALAGTEELATNDIMVDYFAFDDTTPEAVQFKVYMPDEWDLGTIKVKLHWYSASATTSHTTVWGVKARAVSNDDALDGTWGTEIEVSDDVIAAGDLHTTAATAAITVGGTPALGDLIWFEIDQDAAEADHVGDAKLTGVTIQFLETSVEASAW